MAASRTFELQIQISEACTACGACISTCHARALRKARRKPRILHRSCDMCFDCVEICPVGAISEVQR